MTFENRVQAVKLLGLALGAATLGIPSSGRVVMLQFQAKRAAGPNTDDLVCTVEGSDGRPFRVLMQMKRGLTAQPSDSAFGEAVGNAWLDFKDPQFQREADRIVIVHDSGGMHEMRGAHEVAKFATTSLDASDWIEKLTGAGSGNVVKRKALAAIRSIVDRYLGSPVADDELLQFVKHVSFIPHDLDSEGTAEHLSYINQIRTAAGTMGVLVDAESVWSRLVTACMRLNGESGAVGYSNLAAVVGGDLVIWFEHYRNLTVGGTRFFPGSAIASPAGVALGAHLTANALTGSIAQPSNPALAADTVPNARNASVNTLITGTLDRISVQIKGGKYGDATAALSALGSDLGAYDAHQKARRYHMRAVCRWHLGDEKGASADFLKAADLCDDDDKLAAGRVRGLLLKGDLADAVRAGEAALDRFPESISVWLATVNAKLSSNQVLTIEDIPAEHTGEADALHMIAWGYHARGNAPEARRLSLAALKLPTANFFTRDLALAFVLDDIAANPVSNAFRQLGQLDMEDLTYVLNAFEPRHEKLWAFDAPTVVADTAYRLACGALMLGDAWKAKLVCAEARTRGVVNSNLVGIELEALIEDGAPHEALELGEPAIETLPVGGLIAFARLARSTGNLVLLEKIFEAMGRRYPEATTELDILKAMRWEVMSSGGQTARVLDEILTEDARVKASIPLLAASARILRAANDQTKAEGFVAKALELLPRDAQPVVRYMVASLLMTFRRFNDAAQQYELILPHCGRSDIHQDLFYCYIRGDQRVKALTLLQSFPPGWEADEEIRRLAMELGQAAGDWKLLKALVEAQLKQYPLSAKSWLFSLMVAVNTDEADAAKIVSELPAVLEGSIHEQGQLASAEFQYGQPSQGIRRLYSVVRQNLNSTEAAATMLAAHIWLAEKVVNQDVCLDSVQPGVTVTIEDENRDTRTITIDPADCPGLPGAPGFYNAASPEVAQLLGRRVGEVFTIKDGFGGERSYTLTDLSLAYRTIVEHAQRTLRVSITPARTMTLLTLDTDEDGTLNIDKLTAQLERSANQASNVFAQYKTHPFTLGVAAKLLGRDVVTVVQSWPTEVHLLLVSSGTAGEREKAEAQLLTHAGPYVIDAATLTELTISGCLSVLRSLPRVLVSGKTQALLRHCLDLAKANRASGVASYTDGRMVFQEVTPEHRAHELAVITEICDFVERDCTVMPAYGKTEVSPELAQVEAVVSDEEYSAILLALEYDALAISVDSRLRWFLDYCGAPSIWPQALLVHLAGTGAMSTRSYSQAVLNMFLRNRSFIVLNAADLLSLVYQGGATMDYGVRKFIQHISEESIDFSSVTKVTLAFLDILGRGGVCQFGVIIELTQRMLEGLFRHRRCPADFATWVLTHLESPQNMRGWSPGLRKFFRGAVEEAKNAARRSPQNKPIRARTVFCGQPPHLLTGVAEVDYLAEVEAVPAVKVTEDEVEGGAVISRQDDTELTPEEMMGR